MSAVGTPYYWSPEQLEGKAYGEASELWSLGVVAFELLALERPFTASSVHHLAMKVTNADANGEFARMQVVLDGTNHPTGLARVAYRDGGLLAHDPPSRMPLDKVLHVTDRWMSAQDRTPEGSALGSSGSAANCAHAGLSTCASSGPSVSRRHPDPKRRE